MLSPVQGPVSPVLISALLKARKAEWKLTAGLPGGGGGGGYAPRAEQCPPGALLCSSAWHGLSPA